MLVSQSFQDMDAQGVFYESPTARLTRDGSDADVGRLPPLSVQLYNPSYDKDRFENTALDRQRPHRRSSSAVYNGGYLVRNVEQYQDYTNYARGIYADYYQCVSTAESGSCAAVLLAEHDLARDGSRHAPEP